MSNSDVLPLKILVAYPYYKKTVSDRLNRLANEGIDYKLYLDCGAFTAYNTGKTIKLDDYCRFLESMTVKPWRYFGLDVYGDPEASMKNYQTMLDRGFKPVPVFTVGEDPEQLNEYYKTTEVVGVGGLGLAANRTGYLKWLVSFNKNRKMHFLGVTTANTIKSIKPYTCDSSTWIAGGRFGQVGMYLPNGRMEVISLPKLKKGSVSRDAIKALLGYGFTWQELNSADKWKGATGIQRTIGARSWVAMANDFEKKLNTMLFLAVAGAHDLETVIVEYKRLKANS